jgi:simple sugar transport system substrate-binding protein
VFIFHDGGASWKEDGAIGYIGFDSYALGKKVAALSMKAGAKHGLCVNHVPGNVTLENECKGYEEAFKEAGGSAKLQMIQFSDAYNPTFVTQAIKGQLQSDQTIDAVYTMGAEQGLAAAGAIEQLGKKDKIVNGSLGLSVNALQALRNGKILFIADLQPYLDGYYAVVEAYQYAKYGMLPAGEIWTGRKSSPRITSTRSWTSTRSSQAFAALPDQGNRLGRLLERRRPGSFEDAKRASISQGA